MWEREYGLQRGDEKIWMLYVRLFLHMISVCLCQSTSENKRIINACNIYMSIKTILQVLRQTCIGCLLIESNHLSFWFTMIRFDIVLLSYEQKQRAYPLRTKISGTLERKTRNCYGFVINTLYKSVCVRRFRIFNR